MISMKKIFVTTSFILFCAVLFAQTSFNIIPKPVQIIPKKGFFTTSFYSILNQKNSDKQEFIIVKDTILGTEGYSISIQENKLIVKANTSAGLFYAQTTLMQLMPPQVFDTNQSDFQVDLPCCEIVDYPRFPYRGLHLDVSRHYFPVAFIKKYIDLMAMHKMNYFHWHLTDDQGWRIEIKKYPKLQEKASQRNETWIGHYNSGLGYDGKPYGGFYTQEEVKEIVEYAKSKYVTIVPEIEMPGHARAAITAYPELSCTGGPHQVATTWGVFDDVFCSNDETFTFLENVLNEVIAMFPYSPYIHIGGDECPKTRWKECPKCQSRIKKEGLKDENELQTYFVNRMSRFIETHGKKVIGWDEVLEGGIPEDVIIMSWRGEEGAIHAVNAHHFAIMTPNSNMYLDYYQGVPESEPVAIGGFLPLNRVYDYNPIPATIPAQLEKYILGVQGNLWTEYIATPEQAEYMAYPRAIAVAEVAWSPQKSKNYVDFLERLAFHFKRLDYLKVNYSKSHYSIKAATGWLYDLEKPQITLTTECKDCEIRYTLNGENPTLNSPKYNGPIILTKDITLKAQAFKAENTFSPLYSENFKLHLATGKPYQMEHVNHGYSGGHQFALTDGIIAKESAWNRWVGTLGKDMDVSIDLLKPTSIRNVKMQFYNAPDSWIYGPLYVECYVSDNGKDWILIEKKEVNSNGKVPKGIQNIEFTTSKTVRFVRILAKSIGKIPANAQGAGNDAHLFCNEIIVN